MSGNPCLILEWSEASGWPSMFGEIGVLLASKPLRIPQERRPAVVQPDRETAEREAKRLAQCHPGKRFAIFEAHVEGRTVEVASHINLKGEVWMTRKVPALLEIDDSEIPF